MAGVAAIFWLWHATVVHARDFERKYEFDVREKTLGAALNAIAQQTDLIVLFPNELAGTTGMKPVVGWHTVREAIRLLLRGTRLSGGLTEHGVIYISVSDNEQARKGEIDMTGRKVSKSLWAGVAAFLSGIVAHAQESQPRPGENVAGDASGIEEIIVTAQKRVQSLQDVPASIAAISGERLAETGSDGFADYLNSVPGLSMVEEGPGLSTLVLRGVSTGGVRNDEPQNKETVGLYLDEAPISVNGFNPDLGLYDMNRIEVLRGPQGTLYGAGSMGGTIRMITNRPDLQELEGSAATTLSFTRDGGTNYDAKGMINVPLAADVLALRAVAYRSYQDGYLDNPVTGEDDVNDARTSGGRVQLGAKLGERLDANFSHMIHDLKTGARSEQTGVDVFGTRAFDGLSDRIQITNLTLNYEFDGAVLTSSSSYLDKKNLNRTSLEFLVNAVLGLDSPAPLVDTTKVREFSQELRLSSAGNGPLTWIVGGFYQDRSRDYSQNGIVPGLDAVVGAPSSLFGAPAADTAFYGTQNIGQRQFAAFGELGHEVLSHLTATVGVRYFDFKEDFATFSSGLFNDGVTQSAGKLNEDGFTPKFNLSYEANPDALYYAQVAKGFRLGGVNIAVPEDVCQADLAALGRQGGADSFDSDSVWSYEVGAKNRLLERRLTINTSVYYIDWSDIQTTLSLPCAFSFRTNAGKARSIGAEVEAQFRVTDSFDVYTTFGHTDSKLTESVPFTTWVKGDHVPGVPRYTASAGARYAVWPVAGVESFIRLDGRYTSSTNTQFDVDDPDNRRYGDYYVVDLRIGSQIPHSPLELSVYAANLFDSDGRVQAVAGSVVGPERFITVRPRTIGVALSGKF